MEKNVKQMKVTPPQQADQDEVLTISREDAQIVIHKLVRLQEDVGFVAKYLDRALKRVKDSTKEVQKDPSGP